ncbi:unnamed protein product, partial [Prorocentrum cordatum]
AVAVELDWLARAKMSAKSDQKRSMTAVVREIMGARAAEVIIEKGQAEIHAQVKMSSKSPVVAWLIEHASTLRCICNRGGNGAAPFRRAKRQAWQVRLPAFGESVEFKKRTRRELEARWERGLSLGVTVESTEKTAGTGHGVFAAQSLRRLPGDQRCDNEAAEQTGGVPKYCVAFADMDKRGRAEGRWAQGGGQDVASRLSGRHGFDIEPAAFGILGGAASGRCGLGTGSARSAPWEGQLARGAASATSQLPPARVDSDRGRKRGDPPAGSDGHEVMEDNAISIMARLIDHGGEDDEIENAICAQVESQRERLMKSARDSGDECPILVEQPFELDYGDFVGPEDLARRDDSRGKALPGDLAQEARAEDMNFIDTVTGARWIDVDGGDEVEFQARSRPVAKEIQHEGPVEQHFAAMPPLPSSNASHSTAVTVAFPRKGFAYAKKGKYVLQLQGERGALLGHGREGVFVELPEDCKKVRGITSDEV